MYNEIKQVRRTSDEEEANRLLAAGWSLQHIVQNGTTFIYLLVQV